MNQCGDCCWWDAYDEDAAEPTVGECERMTRTIGSDSQQAPPAPPRIAAFLEDGSEAGGVTLWLMTPPDFGCTLWQPRTARG
jgi:hypothetical protein